MINSINSGSTDWYSRKRNQMVDEILLAARSSVTNTEALSTDTESSEETDASATLATSKSKLTLQENMMMMGGMMPPPPPPQAVSDTEEDSEDATFTSTLSSIDADGDGSLSADEYDTLISSLGVDGALSSEDFFSQYDTDGDGEITQEEMDAARPPMGPPPNNQVTDTLPTDIDTDGDGSLSTDEYESLISQMGIEDALSSEDFFSQYDTDGDGEITKAEIDAYAAQAFSAYQQNYLYMDEEEESSVNSIA